MIPIGCPKSLSHPLYLASALKQFSSYYGIKINCSCIPRTAKRDKVSLCRQVYYRIITLGCEYPGSMTNYVASQLVFTGRCKTLLVP